MKEKFFNPLLAPNQQGLGSVLPNYRLGIPAWKEHAESWWAGATIGYPDLYGALAAHKTLQRVISLGEKVKTGESTALHELHELYVQVTQECRQSLITILETDPTQAAVILETSGSSAMALTYHLLNIRPEDVIITTTEEGNLIKPVLMGRDPWNYPKSAFYENVQLYTNHYPSQEKISKVESNKVIAIDVMDNDTWKTNSDILSELQSLLTIPTTACLVIPLATKTGRLLPVREIGALVARHNEENGRRVTYIVDAIQAVGRTDAESIRKPLDYCDAFVCSSSKALGGVVIAAAIVAKPQFVENGVQHLLRSPYAQHLRFYQFDQTVSPEINLFLAKKPEHQAISLPEIASFNSVLQSHYSRGNGNDYQSQRKSQLKKIYNYRLQVMAALEQLPQLLVLDETSDVPLTPSIISLMLREDVTVPTKKLKKMLQDPLLGPTVTPCAPVGTILRLEIPEHRTYPKLERLVNKLEIVLKKGG